MVVKSWFHNLWKSSNKEENSGKKLVIGVLSFEVASLMSKLVCQMELLSDKQVISLWDDITSTVGIKKLVSEDDDYVIRLVCAEMIHNLGNIAKAVARLGKKCANNALNSLECVFDDLDKGGGGGGGGGVHEFEFSWKKMEMKAKKMKKLISASENLCHEMRILEELEETFRRMKFTAAAAAASAGSGDSDGKWLLEYQKKVERKRQEVRNLQGDSLWGKTYDYSVLLMTKSIITIFGRIKHVFGHKTRGGHHVGDSIIRDSSRVLFNSGQPYNLSQQQPLSGYHSGPLGNGNSKQDSKNDLIFHSGPIERSSSSPKVIIPGSSHRRNIFGLKQNIGPPNSKYSKSSILNPKAHGTGIKAKGMEQCNPYLLCSDIFNFRSSFKLLEAPPGSLGAAALGLHYANVILLIEEILQYPQSIAHDMRDNLYTMLPSSIRSALRPRLVVPSMKEAACCSSSVGHTVVAGGWKDATWKILNWLAPLAHNMRKWQSAHSYEQQSSCSRSNVFLVQTLYFADQEKTESLITEMLVGVNYIWRFGREIDAKVFLEYTRSVNTTGGYLENEEDEDDYY
ncbi:hypothetical protein Dimus_021318 [Dionaea muscipula]